MFAKPIAALAGALFVVGAVAVPAGAKSGIIVVRRGCTLGAASKLKVGPRVSDNRTTIEFEVDSNVNGQKWNVRIKDNGVRAFSGVKTTLAPSGSFTARATAPRPSGHAIVARATNPASGETCSVKASI
jgi:hypothetical protein